MHVSPSKRRTTVAALATVFNAVLASTTPETPHFPGGPVQLSLTLQPQPTLQLDENLSSGPDNCNGRPKGQVTNIHGSCASAPDTPGTSEWVTCDGKQITFSYWSAANNCSGTPIFSQQMPLDQCWTHFYGARGSPVRAHCNSTGYNLTYFSLAPPRPSNLSCTISQSKDHNSLTISLRASSNATWANQVSFEVLSKEMRPFLSSTATVSPDGVAEVVVASLEADNGLASAEGLRMGARSHGLSDEEGNPAYWSEPTEEVVNCTVVHQTPEAAAREGRQVSAADSSPASSAPSRWIEVYRFVSQGKLNDFLDQHNAADLLGTVNWLTMEVPNPAPITRYCVEVLDVTLDDIITTQETDGNPRSSSFANFASCNSGQCQCMHQVDRTIARMPRKQILDMCGNHEPHPQLNNSCVCSKKSDEQSAKYVGRTPIPFPYYIFTKLMTFPLKLPKEYPPAWMPNPQGFWYSFPAAARCRPGQALGEGNCTWRREASSTLVHLDQVSAGGLNRTVQPVFDEQAYTFPVSVGLHNTAVLQRSFESLPLRLPPCGAPERAYGGAATAAAAAAAVSAEEQRMKDGTKTDAGSFLASGVSDAEESRGENIIVV